MRAASRTGKTILFRKIAKASEAPPKRPGPEEGDEPDVMIASYEEQVLRAAEGGAVEETRIFEILQTDRQSADLHEYAMPDTACRKTLIGETILKGLWEAS